MDPLVSILIPAYNAERWIKETIESAIKQTWQRKEVIVVDDGSSDRTPEMLRRYGSKSVKIITQENMGGPAARNKALCHAQGDFVQWLDHDDLLDPDKISIQLKNREYDGSTRILFSGAFGTFYFRWEKARFELGPLWKDLSPVDYFLTKFKMNTWIHPSVWLTSRKLADIAGPWCEMMSPDDDGEYFCRVVAACTKIRFIPESISYWRVGNAKSMSQNRSDEALEALSTSIFKSIAHLRTLEDSTRTKDACLTYLQNSLFVFYPEKHEILKKANDLARDLGGSILPVQSMEFDRIRRIVGWKMAKRMKITFWNIQVAVRRNWDRMLFILSGK